MRKQFQVSNNLQMQLRDLKPQSQSISIYSKGEVSGCVRRVYYRSSETSLFMQSLAQMRFCSNHLVCTSLKISKSTLN